MLTCFSLQSRFPAPETVSPTVASLLSSTNLIKIISSCRSAQPPISQVSLDLNKLTCEINHYNPLDKSPVGYKQCKAVLQLCCSEAGGPEEEGLRTRWERKPRGVLLCCPRLWGATGSERSPHSTPNPSPPACPSLHTRPRLTVPQTIVLEYQALTSS